MTAEIVAECIAELIDGGICAFEMGGATYVAGEIVSCFWFL